MFTIDAPIEGGPVDTVDQGDIEAYFIGPDDAESCNGCSDAVEGNPYTLDTVPTPGEFECMSRCRHMVQLAGDAPAELAPYEWNASIGFGDAPPGEYDYPEEALAGDSADVVDPTSKAASDSEGGFLQDLQDLLGSDGSGNTDGVDFSSIGLAIITMYLASEGIYDYEEIAAALGGVDLELVTAQAEELTKEDIMFMLQSGDVDVITYAMEDPTIMDILNELADEGFDDSEALSAESLAQLLNKEAYINETDGRWYIR